MRDSHELVCHIKELASKLGRQPTREEFRSHCGEAGLKKAFGTFTGLLQAAGFTKTEKPSLAEKRQDRWEKAYDEKVSKLQENYQSEIKPYAEKYSRSHGSSMVLCISSDHHSYWLDPFSFDVFVDTCKRLQPNVIVLNGDVLDFYGASSYNKDPRRLLSLQAEIDFVKKQIFSRLRNACPHSQIDFILGNHEIRLWKILVSQAPALAGLEALSFPKLLCLDDYKINLRARPTIINPKNASQENFMIYGDCYCVYHGTSTATAHATVELKKWNMSGCSGHVHHHQVQTRMVMTESGQKKNLTWHSTGSMCRDQAMDYVWDFPRQNQGFNIAHIHNREVVQDYIDTSSSFTQVGGKYYYKKKR